MSCIVCAFCVICGVYGCSVYDMCNDVVCILCVVDTVWIVPTTHVVCQIVPCVVYM